MAVKTVLKSPLLYSKDTKFPFTIFPKFLTPSNEIVGSSTKNLVLFVNKVLIN